MEAYEIKRNTKVRVLSDEVRTPPSSLPISKGDVITILNMDGMYCNCLDKDNNRVYISALTEVEELSQK
jgi:hypothetical protein